MTEVTITYLKNHLSEMVHEVEKSQDVQITRHGKPFAVIVSLERYNQALNSCKGIFNTYQRWRLLHPEANGFTNGEIENMRDRKPHKPTTSSWE